MRRRALPRLGGVGKRLRDPRFWVVQILVIAISVAHVVLEATHREGVLHASLLPVSTYFVPVGYAALNFGVEGAIATSLWCVTLTLPNLILWHTATQRPGVVLQLLLLTAVGYVVARRVDAETDATRHAEAAKARLERLNLTAVASARSLDLSSVLRETAQAMLDPRKHQTSWIVVGSADADDDYVVAATPSQPAELGMRAREATIATLRQPSQSRAAGAPGAVVDDDRIAIVPLCTSGAVAGAVGLASAAEPLSDDDVKMLQVVGSQLGVALANIRHFHETQSMLTELSRAHAMSEEYVRLATDAQEDERKRLARELHDDTIQAMVIAKADLDAIAVEQPAAATRRERLAKVDATLVAAIDNVRRFCRDLRPSLLDDLGLVHAVDWLVADLGARTGIAARLHTSGEPRRLDPKDELTLFRIVQEALRNVERHAHASSVEVRIDFGEDVRTTIVDDGTGFDSSQVLDDPASATGLGLLGMHERAKLAGADLTIGSGPSSGTTVSVTLASGDHHQPRSRARRLTAPSHEKR